ncbi:MAG: hypothetical protein PHI29_12760 [Gallionella sp.]|nr:hypothetical protein [Gallionella sp.]
MFSHTPGTKVQTSAGIITILNDSPGMGGEGQGYVAELNGSKVFYKAFHKSACPPYTPEQTFSLRTARAEALVKLGLFNFDARLNAPFAVSDEGGYVCSYIENLLPLISDSGISYLSESRTYADRVNVVGQLAGLLNLLHSYNIAHGDINSSNIGVVIDASGQAVVNLIDFGNYNAGDASLPPLMAGSEGSMAWWVRESGGLPDVKSDTYSFAIAAHELLLGRPVVAGCSNIAEMLARLERGNLPGDPLLGRDEAGHEVGMPFTLLSPELQSAFRLMLRPQKSFQPAIATFHQTLRASLPNLFACSLCNLPMWWTPARTECVQCGHPVGAAFSLQPHGSQPIPIAGYRVLGRDQISGGADKGISLQHFRIQPTSPGRGQIEVLSGNGIRHQRGAERVFAKQGDTMDIQHGDQLDLGQGTRIAVVA